MLINKKTLFTTSFSLLIVIQASTKIKANNLELRNLLSGKLANPISNTKLHNPRMPKPRDFNGLNGGDLALQNQFPYIVSVQHGKIGKCGGGIIANQFVVTAAHCVIDLETGEFIWTQPEILSSVIDLNKRKVFSTRTKVEQVYVLKAFKPEELKLDTDRAEADIAVLKLEEPFNVIKSLFISKLKLPEKSDNYTGDDATIVGYGWDTVKTFKSGRDDEIYEYGTSRGQLRYAITTVLSNEDCSEVMDTIRDSNICAKVKQRKAGFGEGACAGDSGGPLVHNGILIGVLSTSPIGCEETEGSGVYTRVSSYLDFIQAAMDNHVTEDMRTEIYKKFDD